MKVQVKDIQYLREKTGFGIMDCKKELEKANGDVEKAYLLLEEKGLMVQEKKQERNSEEGIVHAEVFANIGVILEVSTETDFVARSPEFLQSVREMAKIIADKKVNLLDEIIKSMVMKFRENIQLKKYNTIEGHSPYAYTHGNGKYAVILNLDIEEEHEALSKELAMQIIASNPLYISRSDIPKETIDTYNENMLEAIKNDPTLSRKPQKVLDKILAGKIEKFFKENCLIEQVYIKDETMTVQDILKDIKIDEFYRYEKAEATNKCACANNMFID